MVENFIALDAAATQGGQGWSSMIMIVLLIAIFYFLMIRPQQKKEKKIRAMREALKKGDRIITSGGIIGKIKEIRETSMLISVASDVTIEVDKSCIFASAEDAQAQTPANKN